MKWQYKVISQPELPRGAKSTHMDSRMMEDWLMRMQEAGWEFVSYGQTLWGMGPTQEWWIFRSPAGVEV